MYKSMKPCLLTAIGAYFIKLLVDVVMYIFMISEQNDLYFDFWYLFIPQIVSSVMVIGFYVLFYKKRSYGVLFIISTVSMIIANIVFMVLLYFDSTIGYIYYFVLIATVNFLNALYLKCNIVPARKPGYTEYIPVLFELIPFIAMVLSLYSAFCSYPTMQITPKYRIWDYYDIVTAIKLNVVTEFIMIFAYTVYLYNDRELIKEEEY